MADHRGPTARWRFATPTVPKCSSCWRRPRTDGGAVFICEQGKLEINRNKFSSNPREIAIELLKKVDEAEEERKWSDNLALWQARWHMQDWLDCIRTRQRPVADVEIGHRSISVCHLVNITRWVGRRLKFDPVKEQFPGDEEANSFSIVRAQGL